MVRFVLARLASLVPVLLGLSVLLVVWLRSLPGGPAAALLGQRATPERIVQVNEAYGFDEPIASQYLKYLGSVLHGDLGRSIVDGQPVLHTFLERLPATIELGFAALLIAVTLGIPLGYLAACNQGRWLDTVLVSGSLLGVVTPVFFVAILAKLVFADWLHWLPTSGRQDVRIDATHVTNFYLLDGVLTGEWDAAWDALMHLVLPAIALGTMLLAIVVRITRASVAEVLSEDHVRTSRGKGLGRLVIFRRHVLRNAMLPVATTVGLQAGLLLSGAVLTETVFSFHGVGEYLFAAIGQRNYPVLQGYILLIAFGYALINLMVDVSYGVIDPRVRVS